MDRQMTSKELHRPAVPVPRENERRRLRRRRRRRVHDRLALDAIDRPLPRRRRGRRLDAGGEKHEQQR
jgi:hypothetical protein